MPCTFLQSVKTCPYCSRGPPCVGSWLCQSWPMEALGVGSLGEQRTVSWQGLYWVVGGVGWGNLISMLISSQRTCCPFCKGCLCLKKYGVACHSTPLMHLESLHLEETHPREVWGGTIPDHSRHLQFTCRLMRKAMRKKEGYVRSPLVIRSHPRRTRAHFPSGKSRETMGGKAVIPGKTFRVQTRQTFLFSCFPLDQNVWQPSVNGAL